MTISKDLTQEQTNTYLDCRIRALEAVLCELVRGFSTDMCDKFCQELETSTIAPEIKEKMRAYNKELRDKFKPRAIV